MNKRQIYYREEAIHPSPRLFHVCVLIDVLGLDAGWEHLDQLFRLCLVLHHQCDQVPWCASLEFHVVLVLLDLDHAGVLAVDNLEELFDVCDLFGLEI